MSLIRKNVQYFWFSFAHSWFHCGKLDGQVDVNERGGHGRGNWMVTGGCTNAAVRDSHPLGLPQVMTATDDKVSSSVS
jgi:hypothetical protein